MANGRKMPARFSWQPEDVEIIFPKTITPVGNLPEDLETLLWSLDQVSTKAMLDDVMASVAGYMTDHPKDTIVPAALARIQNRVEHST